MIEFFKTINGKIEKVDTISKHCWINVINPDDSELEYLYSFLNIEKNFIKAALDEEETSRVESEDGNVLVIVDVPSVQKDDDTVIYSTMPLGIILTEEYIITVCLRESSVINDFTGGYIKDVETSFKTRFFLILLYKVANRFLQYLRQIEKLSVSIEKKLQISMKNKELIQILDLEKSLIYFTTSLKANEATLNKISRGGGRYFKLYDEDQELLEDVLIENNVRPLHRARRMITPWIKRWR
jgi:magnesium transporter